MGILAEFATKINVISTQDDISKLVYDQPVHSYNEGLLPVLPKQVDFVVVRRCRLNTSA